ncbi:MAG: hypothetical protein ACRDPK_14870 [Carbonactinosporaceae bacterium]
MGDSSDATVGAALDQLRRVDRTVAQNAEAAWNSLTSGESLQTVSQLQVQDFLWYHLPVKFLTSLDDKIAVATALGQLFEQVLMPRYADLCTRDTTREVLAAYERDVSEGKEAYRRASEASGVLPPDLPELGWGSPMGAAEAEAFSAVACALELAIASGELRPGVSGWRGRRRERARAYLSQPRPELGGSTHLHLILGERVQEWTNSNAEPRTRMLASVATWLLDDRGVPSGAENALAPLSWLLNSTDDSLRLTARGNLARATVLGMTERFGWWRGRTNAPQSELDVVEVQVVRDLAESVGALRRRGSRLYLTTTGRRLRGDTSALWEAMVAKLASGDGFPAAVSELALAVLLPGKPLETPDLVETVAQVVAAEGWRERETGSCPDAEAVAVALREIREFLVAMSLVRPPEPSSWPPVLQLNEVGQAAALAALRARATAPQRQP